MPAHNSMVGGPPLDAPQVGAYSQVPLQGTSSGSVVIDGTPLRVVTIVALSVGGVMALRWAGFKFNVIAGV